LQRSEAGFARRLKSAARLQPDPSESEYGCSLASEWESTGCIASMHKIVQKGQNNLCVVY